MAGKPKVPRSSPLKSDKDRSVAHLKDSVAFNRGHMMRHKAEMQQSQRKLKQAVKQAGTSSNTAIRAEQGKLRRAQGKR